MGAPGVVQVDREKQAYLSHPAQTNGVLTISTIDESQVDDGAREAGSQ